MLDFLSIRVKNGKNGTTIIPMFDMTIMSKDILVKGKVLYGIWDSKGNKWITKLEKAAWLVDRDIKEFADTYKKDHPNESISVEYLRDDSNRAADRFLSYIRKLSDCDVYFNSKMIFSDQEIAKEDYCTIKAKYKVEEGSIENYDKLISTLYYEEERHKIEWLIGAVIAGENLNVQKFGVMYGPPGSGKSTILEIIYQLFEGYYATFNSKDIARGDSFSLSAFKKNPLVAVDAEGDLSKIETNTTLNTLTAHDIIKINEKYQAKFDLRSLAIIFICTNSPVKITDSKSGLLRRLIDINPSGNILPIKQYRAIMKAIPFELGAIAYHCREVYLDDPEYYSSYRPTEMFEETNDFYDFMLSYYQEFAEEEYVSLTVAWERYKAYIEDGAYSYRMNKRNFKNELKNYFEKHEAQSQIIKSDGSRAHIANVYSGFKKYLFRASRDTVKKAADEAIDGVVVGVGEKRIGDKDIYEGLPDWLHLVNAVGGVDDDVELSVIDNDFNKMFYQCRAQYASSGENETPKKKWENITTKLKDILSVPDAVHYVMTQDIEPSLIVIDFDRKDKDGKKSLRLNLEAASAFPRTYAEVSKGGQGLHLHYIYDGDVNELSRLYDDEIEIKVFKGLSALRRRLTLCNNEKIAHINSGLPLKGEKGAKMIDPNVVLNEKAIRTAIRRNLAKEYHADTTSSVHFIKKILDDAHASGEPYDVRDLRTAVMNFAAKATNQSQHCMELVMQMEFCSNGVQEADLNGEGIRDNTEDISKNDDNEKPIVFYDIEIFPNLFVVCYKKAGPGGKENCVKMINPTANDIENLISTSRLIGFNNRRYDNHMLYGRILGYSNEKLFELSKKLINSDDNTKDKFHGFTEAYNISYTDVWDFAINKQSLKKWEIELGIHHQELGLPWDKPAPKDRWEEIADYCCNDVVATEATFNHLDADWEARQILADISGGTVNDTTNALTLKLVFGDVKKPKLIYTDLATGEQVESMGGL